MQPKGVLKQHLPSSTPVHSSSFFLLSFSFFLSFSFPLHLCAGCTKLGLFPINTINARTFPAAVPSPKHHYHTTHAVPIGQTAHHQYQTANHRHKQRAVDTKYIHYFCTPKRVLEIIISVLSMTTLWPSSCLRASCPKYTSSSRTCAGWHRPAITSNGVWFYPGAGLHPRRCVGFRFSQATLAKIRVAVEWNRRSIRLRIHVLLKIQSCFLITAPNWPRNFFQSKRGPSSWTKISFRYHKYTINQHINAKKMGSDPQICMTQITHSFITKVTSNPCTPTFDWIIAAQIQHPPNQKWSFK